MVMWTVVMVLMKPIVMKLDLAKCAKHISSVAQMVAPALRKALFVTSTRTALMVLMRNTVVS
jgi:hypothetical protein